MDVLLNSLSNVVLTVALIVVPPVLLYICARLVTHAVLKTRREFGEQHNNGGSQDELQEKK